MIWLLLSTLAAQTQVTDGENGITLHVPEGWGVTNDAGRDGIRLSLRPLGEEDPVIHVSAKGPPDPAVVEGKWDDFVEKYQGILKAQYSKVEVLRREAGKRDEAQVLRLWLRIEADGIECLGTQDVLVSAKTVASIGAFVPAKHWERFREAIEKTCSTAKLGAPGKGVTYRDRAHGFAVDIPAGWRVKPRPSATTVVGMTAGDGSRTNFNVVVRPPTSEFDALPEERIREALEGEIRAQVPDYAIVTCTKGKRGECTTVTLCAEFSIRETKMSNMQWFLCAPKKSYYLTWTVGRDAFKEWQDRFAKHLETFAADEDGGGK